ncbi:FKBP-type peptidyl-prolyl cis-trans isomerase [Flavobacterium wongokense]|uniref:FKBP-type peptidyl-prolyl cis-trans isomerase n=1 Tax=Flavobacterium wongokense TaxID=2910674 RepID=UPI001F410A6D|nr:FKBP-type peptidylprolyl isomerase [Flavobacterium sp. WG47]MCF6133174.1 FKBP-type peptidylprolyl isomerase [Flavobacterium sp. WG47]
MNNFFKFILLFSIGLTIVSCSKSDSQTPLRDYTEQYTKDITNIETFLNTHYLVVEHHPGETEDLDVSYPLIDAGQTSIMNQLDYPIQTRLVTVKQNDVDITYKIYYLKLREGSGPDSKSPCNVDRVLTSYRGEYIYSSTETVGGTSVTTIKSTQFEELINPQSYFNLTGVIRGWSEIFPQFKTGTYVGNPDGTVTFDNFGAGVMFIPSGLAYFGGSTAGVPAYSPLIFSIKLYEVQRVDHDSDGIDSYLEDISSPDNPGVADGYVYSMEEGVVNPDDTDGDEKPDFLDTDDDGDFFTTASEIKNPITGQAYPFANIPTCGGTGNGKKNYLDPSCHGAN